MTVSSFLPHTVSLLPPQTGSLLPPPVVAGITDEEKQLVNGLSTKLAFQSVTMVQRWQYYDGTQRMQNLGISVPQQLAGVETVVDWPRICVDPIVQGCVLDGFRLAGETDVDQELLAYWRENDMDAEAPLSFLDALVAGRGYMIIGAPDSPSDAPLVTVESPLNLAMEWDPRTRSVSAAYQSFQVDGVYVAVLYTPSRTVHMSRHDGSSSEWEITNVDAHNFGEVPVVRLPNRARSADREGRSEITKAIMNTTDSACRSLLGMEIAREFYSIPHRYILGASESDFVDAQGNKKTSIEMAMNKFLAIERDERGDLPTVGQFTAFDPSVFTKIVDEHAQLMSSYTGFPPSYFGQNTSANPASADAIRVSEGRKVLRALEAQRQFTGPLRHGAQLMWRFAHQGQDLPDALRALEVDWVDPSTRTPAATTDAIYKQAAMGAVPPTSDVVLARLGYDAVDRARLEVDRKVDAGASILAELASSLQAKEARVDTTIAHDINPKAAAAPTVPMPPVAPVPVPAPPVP